jgi:D-alanyl-D-alanine carboxypeptidase
VKAAELLESGFTQNPLSWLTPALGSVDALAPIDAAPPNLHEEICGPHRKRPAVEEEEGETSSEDSGAEPSIRFSTLLSSLRAPAPKGAALLSDQGAVTPIIVYTGPTRTPAQLANLEAAEPAAVHKKKGAPKSGTAKLTDEKVAPDGKAPTDKTSKNKAAAGAWTPTSSSSLAASPPAGLETKPAADKAKKQKPKPPVAPTPAQ